jgi:uncharacterized protein YciI
MDKKYFALKLLPGRPDFAQTMTEDEKTIMQQHVAYWKDYMDKGMVVVFGPVFDPKGVFGLGILAVDTEEQVNEFIEQDPAAKINTYEYYPMMAIVP